MTATESRTAEVAATSEILSVMAAFKEAESCLLYTSYSHPWITHCSIQRIENLEPVTNTAAWRTRYRKPIVVDEMCYEGNIEHGWGNISGRELLYRFWTVTIQAVSYTHLDVYKRQTLYSRYFVHKSS